MSEQAEIYPVTQWRMYSDQSVLEFIKRCDYEACNSKPTYAVEVYDNRVIHTIYIFVRNTSRA
jgi:hypothetical protein